MQVEDLKISDEVFFNNISHQDTLVTVSYIDHKRNRVEIKIGGGSPFYVSVSELTSNKNI